jgi:hypothetical protein
VHRAFHNPILAWAELITIEIPNSFLKTRVPEKKVDFQIVITPPEAPTEGKNSIASNTGG